MCFKHERNNIFALQDTNLEETKKKKLNLTLLFLKKTRSYGISNNLLLTLRCFKFDECKSTTSD